MPAWLRSLLVLGAYLLIALAMFPNVVAHVGTAFPGDLGDPPSQAWILAWDVHALLTAPAHLFDGNIFYPFHDVLAYQDSLLGVLPLSVPVLVVSGNPILAYNVVFLLSFAFCSWGAYLLVHLLSGEPRAAFPAGLVFGFSPYRMVHLYHLNLLCGMWVPFVFLCWERVRRGDNRFWIGCGLFFVLQALTSLYYAAFLAVALALLLALHIRRLRKNAESACEVALKRLVDVRPLLMRAVVTAVASGLLLAPLLAPYFRVERALGTTRGLGQDVYFAADVRDFLHNVDRSVLYGWTGNALGIGPNVALQYLWPGAIALSLALWGLLSQKRKRSASHTPAAAYGVLCTASALLCLGPFLKVWGRQTAIPLPYVLLHWLPGFAGLRDPARFGLFYTLGLAVLAGIGTSLLMKRLPRRATLLAALLCAGVLAESWIRPLPAAALPVGSALPPEYRWLSARPAGSAVLELPAGLQNKVVWAWQAEMMFYSTFHWQPIVNGTGGFAPPGYDHDVAIYNSFPSLGALRLLQRRRVRYVIVHRSWLGAAAADTIFSRSLRAGIRCVRRWSDADVYAVPGARQ